MIIITIVGVVLFDDGQVNNEAENKSNLLSESTVEKQMPEKPNRWKFILDSLNKIPNKSKYKEGQNIYSGLSFKVGKTFTYDRYGDTYHYSTAERGDKYITSNVNIKSESKDPALHMFALYYLDSDSSLILVNAMEYRFQRWEDYGTYLGNYLDKNNDFAYSETVKFTLGTTIPENLLKNKLFIVSIKTPSFIRSVARFDNPPVSYSSNGKMVRRISKDFEWTENGYTLISIIK